MRDGRPQGIALTIDVSTTCMMKHNKSYTLVSAVDQKERLSPGGNMQKRLLIGTMLGLLVVVGLVSGLFAGAIQQALTLPMVQAMMRHDNAQVPARPKALPTPQATSPVQGQTNVLAQDTFQRGDQPLWGTASDGRQWDGDANVKQIFTISGGAGRITGGQGAFNALLGPASMNVEVVVNGMINQFGNGVNLGVVLRWSDADHWYKALVDGTHLTILKRADGRTTTISTVPLDAQGGVPYMLRFRAIGAMLFARAWRSDTPEPTRWQAATSDTTLASGQVGLRVVTRPTTILTIASFGATNATMGDTI